MGDEAAGGGAPPVHVKKEKEPSPPQACTTGLLARELWFPRRDGQATRSENVESMVAVPAKHGLRGGAEGCGIPQGYCGTSSWGNVATARQSTAPEPGAQVYGVGVPQEQPFPPMITARLRACPLESPRGHVQCPSRCQCLRSLRSHPCLHTVQTVFGTPPLARCQNSAQALQGPRAQQCLTALRSRSSSSCRPTSTPAALLGVSKPVIHGADYQWLLEFAMKQQGLLPRSPFPETQSCKPTWCSPRTGCSGLPLPPPRSCPPPPEATFPGRMFCSVLPQAQPPHCRPAQ